MTQHYLVVADDVVVAKRAIGPEPDGSCPPPPPGSVLVSADDYFKASPGWERRGASFVPPTDAPLVRSHERFAQIEARVRALARQTSTPPHTHASGDIVDLEARWDALVRSLVRNLPSMLAEYESTGSIRESLWTQRITRTAKGLG